MPISSFTHGAVDAFRNLGDFASDLGEPTIRLGVTGLARSGKTVFITALVHNLMAQARMPFFDAVAHGRVLRVYLEPQPDDQVPRFDYERHMADLTATPPRWPESTRRISQLRLAIEYETQKFWKRQLGYTRLNIDIVDYPGEWLLDLPLLQLDYSEWSRAALEQSGAANRKEAAKDWHAALTEVDPATPADEATAQRLSDLFKTYLRDLRGDNHALSTLPPGRFLMPGDLEGSPALTFAPLEIGEDTPVPGSLAALMESRFEAYKRHVALPFFRDHFARLDRQIVLVDLLTPLNAGAAAVADLEAALDHVLAAFRVGRNSLLSALFAPRIDRVLFAAAKADRLHHTSHDRLEAILSLLVERAYRRASEGGAKTQVLALAALRSTREATVRDGRASLPSVIGVPEAGERIGDEVFDGLVEAAIYPGDLPQDPKAALDAQGGLDLRFVRFRPPLAERDAKGKPKPAPHIRLDRAIEFLIGDRLA